MLHFRCTLYFYHIFNDFSVIFSVVLPHPLSLLLSLSLSLSHSSFSNIGQKYEKNVCVKYTYYTSIWFSINISYLTYKQCIDTWTLVSEATSIDKKHRMWKISCWIMCQSFQTCYEKGCFSNSFSACIHTHTHTFFLCLFVFILKYVHLWYSECEHVSLIDNNYIRANKWNFNSLSLYLRYTKAKRMCELCISVFSWAESQKLQTYTHTHTHLTTFTLIAFSLTLQL